MPLNYLSCFFVALRGLHMKINICQTNCYLLQNRNFPLFWSHTWMYNIQANERLTKVKEKWSNNKFGIFVLYFIHFLRSNVLESISVIIRNGVCWWWWWCMCWWCICNRLYQMNKTASTFWVLDASHK